MGCRFSQAMPPRPQPALFDDCEPAKENRSIARLSLERMIVPLDTTRNYCVMSGSRFRQGQAVVPASSPACFLQSKKTWNGRTSPAMTECYFNVVRPRRRPRLASNASHSATRRACRCGNDIKRRDLRCRCHSRKNRERFFECPMEATDYKPSRAIKAFATSARGGMHILSPAGRSVRFRLPPGCPAGPYRTITPIRCWRASRVAGHPLLLPQQSSSANDVWSAISGVTRTCAVRAGGPGRNA